MRTLLIRQFFIEGVELEPVMRFEPVIADRAFVFEFFKALIAIVFKIHFMVLIVPLQKEDPVHSDALMACACLPDEDSAGGNDHSHDERVF